MIYSKDDVKRLLNSIKDLQRYDWNYTRCECCGVQLEEEPEADGAYIKFYDLERVVKDIEDKL